MPTPRFFEGSPSAVIASATERPFMFLATFTLGDNDSPDEKILLNDGSVELPPVGIGAQPVRAAAVSNTGKA
ncbi:hypothetical protein D9M68_960580 [compost metagenome]